jgi:hypothetical protein
MDCARQRVGIEQKVSSLRPPKTTKNGSSCWFFGGMRQTRRRMGGSPAGLPSIPLALLARLIHAGRCRSALARNLSEHHNRAATQAGV